MEAARSREESRVSEWRIIAGDCRATLADLEPGSVQTCVTSPPYFGLRDYGHDGQIGLESTPDEFVTAMVDVFRAVRHVLRDDGTVWLNLGDSYAGGKQGRADHGSGDASVSLSGNTIGAVAPGPIKQRPVPPGYKPKDLLGIPWMVAFALRTDGWYLRSDIVWAKPGPMPEPVKDRPTRSHEFIFLLSKSPVYYYDHEAVQEDAVCDRPSGNSYERAEQLSKGGRGQPHPWQPTEKRNRRDVWTVSSQPFPARTSRRSRRS
jgi:DNA modification methylase